VTTIRLGCGRAGTLFYEPGGLLLRSCLIPVGAGHAEHLLTFQLGYLGPGEITVHILLDGAAGARSAPKSTTALLRGTDADEDDDGYESAHYRIPGVWLTYVTLSGAKADCRYIVSGQAGAGLDDLRGELVSEISGTLPLLTATTRTTATRNPLSAEVRSQPVMDWDQTDGSGSAPCCAQSPVMSRTAVRGGERRQQALHPMRNIRT
jgi:hypothetical protein